jgi:hypothetical protein
MIGYHSGREYSIRLTRNEPVVVSGESPKARTSIPPTKVRLKEPSTAPPTSPYAVTCSVPADA